MSEISYLKLVFIAFQFLPLPIAQGHISNHLGGTSYLQSSKSKGLGGIDHGTEEHYYSTPKVPGADQVAHTQSNYLNFFDNTMMGDIYTPKGFAGVEHGPEEKYYPSSMVPRSDQVVHNQSEYLKFIEDILMDDSDEMELNEFQPHPVLHPTSSWIYPPADIDNIYKSQAVEYHSHPIPNTSKRLKLLDTTPTHFQEVDPKSNLNQETIAPEVQLKNKWLIPPHSRIFNEPTMSSKDTQKNENKPNSSNNLHHTIPSIPEQCSGLPPSSSCLQNIEDAPPRKLVYRACRQPIIIYILKWKGGLGVWHDPELLNQIQTFFDSINRHEQLDLQSCNNGMNILKIDSAIQRVMNDVVMAYLGGIIIMHSASSNMPSVRTLVVDGWKFIQKYLYQQFYPSHSHQIPLEPIEFERFPKPFNLLKHILSLKKGKSIPPSLIETLIYHWAQQSNLQPCAHGIEINTHNLLSKTQSVAMLMGQQIGNKAPRFLGKKTSSQFPTIKGSSHVQFSFSDNSLPLNSINKKTCALLQSIGRGELKDQASLLDQIDTFFKNLETNIQVQLHKAIKVINVPSKAPLPPNHVIIDQYMIKGVINTVQNNLVPQVLGTLILLQPCQKGDQIKEDLLKTGWEALKVYFSSWKSLFLKDPTSISFPEYEDLYNIARWYDPKFMMHYYCMRHRALYHSPEPMWFIVEVWYEMVVGQMADWSSELKFKPMPPNRDIYDKIISYLEENPHVLEGIQPGRPHSLYKYHFKGISSLQKDRKIIKISHLD